MQQTLASPLHGKVLFGDSVTPTPDFGRDAPEKNPRDGGKKIVVVIEEKVNEDLSIEDVQKIISLESILFNIQRDVVRSESRESGEEKCEEELQGGQQLNDEQSTVWMFYGLKAKNLRRRRVKKRWKEVNHIMTNKQLLYKALKANNPRRIRLKKNFQGGQPLHEQQVNVVQGMKQQFLLISNKFGGL